MISLANVVSSLPEDTDVSQRIQVADIIVADDGLGTNVLGIVGADHFIYNPL